MNKLVTEAIFNLMVSVDNELDVVRKKYNIINNNFSCSYFVKMAEANDKLKEMLIIKKVVKKDLLTEQTGMTEDERKWLG